MAINILKWRPSMPKAKVPSMGSIGEPDAHVFNCPKCARPLTEGTPRCTGCGTRLIMGVAFKRASTLMAFGFVIGTFIGGAVLSVVLTTLLSPTVADAVVIDPVTGVPTTGGPAASAAPNMPDLTVPAAALSAMRQSALLDLRIAADREALNHAYKSKAPSSDIALILRSLAADAAIGSDLVPQLNSWPTAHSVAADRAAFYSDISERAHDGLRASYSERAEYRTAAKGMLRILNRMTRIDTASRALASVAGIELPAVDTKP